MSQEIEGLVKIIDWVEDREWEDEYYLNSHKRSEVIAQEIHDRGYRRKVDVVKEIIDEIENFIVDECSLTDAEVVKIYKHIRSLKSKYTSGLKYQQRVSTYGDMKALYQTLKGSPFVKQFRGYTTTKSYGFDTKSKDIIKKDGEFWFDNPFFVP